MSNESLLPPVSIDLAAEFPILSELAFFNHAGVAPLSRRAGDALRAFASQGERFAYFQQGWYRRVREVKKLAAKLINAEGENEIAFVANTSTGVSMIAKGIAWRPGDNVIITGVEYPANRYPWEDLKRFGVELIEVPQQPDFRIDVEDVVDAVTDRTRIVSISHVQYASGFRIDLKPISDMVHKVGGYLCVDAIQSLGAMPVDVQRMGIDFLTADGHKWMLGPEGCGILYVREDLIELLHPNVVGWMNMVDASNYGDYKFQFERDARRFEPGSYNLPGIFALGASLELLMEVGLETVWSRIDGLTTRLCEGLKAKGYRVLSPRGQGEQSGIVIFEVPDASVRAVPAKLQIVMELEKQGMVIVIREGRLRASPHFYNSIEQIDRLVESLP
ncbi:MAG: aminotransferase class V-fold PLP-dependent enzyme [Phycisphaeraceae bacterium]